MKATLNRARAQYAAAGQLGVFHARAFGTRYYHERDAGIAPDRQSAAGIGKHSVYEGPMRVLGGPPVVKREKIA